MRDNRPSTEPGAVHTASPSTGGTRTSSTTTTFDNGTGLPTTVENDQSDAPPKCTTTTYAPTNTTAWIVGLPSEVNVVAKDCAHTSSAVYPGDAISDAKTTYDGGAWNDAATKGDATQVQVVDKYTGSTAATAHWVTQAATQYDALGRMTQATDVLGHTSTTAYTPSATAAAGSGALTGETIANTAPFNWTTTTQFDPAWGVETSYSNENGSVTTASYDALGRRTAVWDPDNPQSAAPTQPSEAYAYTLSQSSPNAIETKSLAGTTITDSFVLFDGLGRQLQTQKQAEGGGADITDNWYDAQGRIWTTNGDYWASGTSPSVSLFVPTAESQIAQENVTTFDAVGRATKQELISFGVERHETNTNYLGADRVDVTPPAGGTPTSTFTNSLGQKTELRQYLAATPTGTAEKTTYAYNVSGQMTSMVDPAGNTWSWGFDVLGHQITATDPDTGTTTQTFDNAGNVLSRTDARGITLAYSYDALNRKTAEYQNAVGSSGIELASWSYDTATNGKSLPAASTRFVGSTTGTPGAQYIQTVNSYDAAGDVTKSTQTIPTSAPAFAGSYATTFTYATSGDLTSTLYPAEGGLAAERVKTTYDGLGRPGGLSGTNNYDIVDYSAIGQITRHTRFGTDSLYTDYGYDNGTGQLLQIRQLMDDGTVVHNTQTADYTNDAAGNVTSIATSSDSAATDTQCFSYDRLQELTSAWTPTSGNCATAPTAVGLGGPAPYWTNYAVDPATGNRTGTTSTATSGTATIATYNYATAGSLHPHAVQSVATTIGTGAPSTSSYGYNAEGDTTTRPGETLTYDPEGNLATVTDGTKTQSNTYDASGTLLLQKDDASYTLYMGGTELHKDGTGSVYAIRTYGIEGTAVAERTTGPTGGNVLRWLGGDNHNTASLEVVASTGATAVRYGDPYGNPRGTNPAWSSGHSFLNDDQAATSATVTIGARTYDPALGKFLTIDAVLTPMNPLANNGYAYTANDPVGFSDPSGNCMLNPDSNRCFLNAHSADAAAASPSVPKPAGKSQISPHVFLGSSPGDASRLRQEFDSMRGDNTVNETVEMNLWYLICENGGGCPQSFLDTLRRAQQSGINDGPSPLSAAIGAGRAIFTIDGPAAEWNEGGKFFVFPSGGTSRASKTFDLKGTGWRLDVENPGSGKGNIHIQPESGHSPKYYYNPISQSFTDEDGAPAPARAMAKLQASNIWQRQISKALRYFPDVASGTSGGDPDEADWGVGGGGE